MAFRSEDNTRRFKKTQCLITFQSFDKSRGTTLPTFPDCKVNREHLLIHLIDVFQVGCVCEKLSNVSHVLKILCILLDLSVSSLLKISSPEASAKDTFVQKIDDTMQRHIYVPSKIENNPEKSRKGRTWWQWREDTRQGGPAKNQCTSGFSTSSFCSCKFTVSTIAEVLQPIYSFSLHKKNEKWHDYFDAMNYF